MLNLTNEFYESISHLSYSEKVSGNTWNLNCIQDKPYYISTGKKNIDLLKNSFSNTIGFFCDSNIECAAFMIFYDHEGRKISSVSCLNYKKLKFNIPDEADYFEAAIRLKNNNITRITDKKSP